MNRKNGIIILFLFIASALYLTGCTSDYKLTENIAKDMRPVELFCCEKYNYNLSSYNPIQGYSSCCLETESPDKCNTCITEENARRAEEIRTEKQKRTIVISLLLLLFSITSISLLLIISNKITSLVKDSHTGFLNPKLNKIVTRLFVISIVVISILTLLLILYIRLRIPRIIF